MKKLETLARKNLSEIAAESIKEYIFENALKAGDKLPTEVELMEILGVSRSTVREAIKQIQMFGVLDVKPGQGAVIREFDHDIIFSQMSWGVHLQANESSFRELIDARIAIEMGILPLIVANIDEEDLRDLEEEHAAMEATTDLANHRRHDAVFHQILLKSTKNGPIIHMGSILMDLFRKKIELYPSMLPVAKLKVTADEHQQIIDACRESDVDKLREVLQIHLARD